MTIELLPPAEVIRRSPVEREAQLSRRSEAEQTSASTLLQSRLHARLMGGALRVAAAVLQGAVLGCQMALVQNATRQPHSLTLNTADNHKSMLNNDQNEPARLILEALTLEARRLQSAQEGVAHTW